MEKGFVLVFMIKSGTILLLCISCRIVLSGAVKRCIFINQLPEAQVIEEKSGIDTLLK